MQFIIEYLYVNISDIVCACFTAVCYNCVMVQELIKLICDVKAMENAVMEMKYDANKAPLGLSLC